VLWRLAWRNLWRSPRRTGIVVLAVAVGISGSLLSMAVNYGMVDQMVQTAIETELGHVQIHAPGWDDDPKLERMLDDEGRAAERALAASPSLRAAAARVRGDGLVSSARESTGVRVVGVDPEREPGISLLRASLVEGEWFGDARLRAVVGQKLAERLEVEVGDKIAVSVQDARGDLTGGGFRVAGTFRTSSSDFDRSTVLLRLGEAQQLLALGKGVTEIVAVASDDGEVDALAEAAARALGDTAEVRTWSELQPLLMYLVQTFDMMAWYLYAAVFTAMAFGIANVLLMAVHERTREIGMLRAMGMPRRDVIALVVLESLLVTFVGLAIGVALALAGTFALRDGIDLSAFAEGLAAYGVAPRIAPVLRARDLVMPLVVAGITAGLASLWPAVRAARFLPAEALRRS
jgi:ABC-type lipoprotein release transport system permease subunit